MKECLLYNSRFGQESIDKIKNYLEKCTVSDSQEFKDKILIRYGNRTPVQTNGGTITYNRSDAIKRASNKRLSRELFIENNISCPKFTSTEESEFEACIARPLKHSQGNDFYFLETYDDYVKHHSVYGEDHYYSQFIDKTQEFRVHCAHGKVLVLSEKAPPKEKVLAWNRHNSEEGFKVITWNNAEPYYDLMINALKAIESLGLDFGAVDVIVKDGIPYILEVNTRWDMSNSNYTCKRYALYFDWLQSNTRKEHWDFNQFTLAKSLFWKNNQLN